MSVKRIFFSIGVLMFTSYSFSQNKDGVEKIISEFKQLSGYSEYVNKNQLPGDQKKNQFSKPEEEVKPLSIDFNAVTLLKNFKLKNQSIFFYYDQGIERKSFFQEQNGVRDVTVRFFVGSKGSTEAQEWIISDIALKSSLPVEKIAAKFKVKEGTAGDFSMGIIENGRSYHSFAFCRQNICVLLKTGDADFDLLALAKEIDTELIKSTKSSQIVINNPENATVEAVIPDSIPPKHAVKIQFKIKKQTNINVEMNVSSTGNLRCEKISSNELMIISHNEEDKGEIGIVLYDPNTLISKWFKHKVFTKKLTPSVNSK